MQRLISIVASSIMVLALFGVCAAQSAGAAEPLARITVEAGEHTRVDTPVSVSLEGAPLGFPAAEYMLLEIKPTKGKSAVEIGYRAAQLEGGSPPRLWFVLSGETKAGTKRTFELLEVPRGKARGVSVKKHEDYYEILHSGQKVLRYNHAIVPPPEGQDKLYERSGFIHPLWSPKGTVLTNIHPADHIHHLGIWMPWTHTEFEGKPVDFWNLKGGQGTVRFVKFLSTTDGPVYGGFEAEQEHVVLKTDSGEKVVLNEVWDVRVYSVGGAKKGYWLWDFKSTQRCVADSPLRQVKYRYGGFGFRGAAEWDEENSVYLTSEGKNRKDGHTTRARWCDTSGKIDDWQGVTFYSHPENFEHPEPMRIWPSGQVFFNFCPSQATDWEMKPGEDHVFRYRLYVHEGKITVPAAERVWADYAEPPKVTIEAAKPEGALVLLDARTKLSKHWTAGKDKNDEEKKIGWDVEGGVATIAPKSGSIWTKRDFTDFKMHIEFRIPQMPPNVKGQGRGNSGVYIQRRYELQILDSYGQPPRKNEGGSIYKFRAPDKNASKKPGEWQSYDIEFHAAKFEGGKKVKDARISLRHNGDVVHDDIGVPNKTGAGKAEGPDPGPILLQDHGNAVSFRNIWIVPL